MSPRPDPSVAVSVATFRRPEGIRALLGSLDRLAFERFAPRVTVIIVDNDPSHPAFASAAEAQAASRWPLRYLAEPRRGIVAARNRGLAEAGGHDFIAFVDDDETVGPGWLEALLATQAATGAAVVQGPVEPAYGAPPPPWMERLGIFRLGPWEEGAALAFAATNNSLADLRFLAVHAPAFDPRFNDTGGEDEELFGRVRAAGGRIHAAAGAVVHDSIPPQRMTLGWVLRRWHRMGNTLGRIALLRRQGRALRLAKGFGALGLGALRAVALAPVSRAGSIRGLMEAARGAGMLSAFLRLTAAEYAPARLAADRPEAAPR